MTVGQPRVWSAIEVITDHALGSILATPIRIIIAPWFGLHLSIEQHLQLTILLYILSLVRSFTSRRIFNWWNVFQMRRKEAKLQNLVT